MEEFKNLSVWDLLMFLQGKIKQNTVVIKDNNHAINSVDSKASATPDLIHRINTLTRLNSNLTNENASLLNLFNSLIKLNKDYRANLLSIAELSEVRIDEEANKRKKFKEYLRSTISGEVELNKQHPYINDRGFLKTILQIFAQREDYEKCSLVQQQLNAMQN